MTCIVQGYNNEKYNKQITTHVLLYKIDTSFASFGTNLYVVKFEMLKNVLSDTIVKIV